ARGFLEGAGCGDVPERSRIPNQRRGHASIAVRTVISDSCVASALEPALLFAVRSRCATGARLSRTQAVGAHTRSPGHALNHAGACHARPRPPVPPTFPSEHAPGGSARAARPGT